MRTLLGSLMAPALMLSLALAGLSSPHAGAAVAAPTRVTGADISWPQCPKGMGIPERQGEDQPMPLRTAKFVVVGLTNGPSFHPNPCLASQVGWIKRQHLRAAAYAVSTYPTRAEVRQHGSTGPHPHQRLSGRLWNTGYAAAQFNVATMERVELTSPIVWVDVEPYSVAPWSGTIGGNQAVVRGVVQGYRDAGLRVGVYSTQSLWAQIVGGLRLGLPEWRTAGQTTMGDALYKCSHYPIQGGTAVMAQWWGPHRDFDVMCPGYGRPAQLGKYFTQY